MAQRSKPWAGITIWTITFDFPSRPHALRKKRAISPLQAMDKVDVIGLPSVDECEKDMFVTIRWEKDGLAVPLSQLKPIRNTDAQTREAIEDWHYWVNMGYQFG